MVHRFTRMKYRHTAPSFAEVSPINRCPFCMNKVQKLYTLTKFCIVRDLANVLHRLESLASQYIPQVVTRVLIGYCNHVRC